MKKAWVGLALALLTGSTSAAGLEGAGIGAAWLNLQDDARSAGMAGALTGFSAGLSSLNVNVAGLSLNEPRLGVSYLRWIEDGSLQTVAYGQPAGPGTVGVSLHYFDFGTVDRVSAPTSSGSTMQSSGQIHPYGAQMNLAYAQPVGDLAFGAGLRLVDENLGAATERTAALNLGGLWQSSSVHDVSVGFAVANLGPELAGYSLPVELRLGVGWVPSAQPKLQTALDLRAPLADRSAFQAFFGAEYEVHTRFALRAGGRLGADNTASGVTAGFTAHLAPVELHYAFQSVGALGASHLLSLEYSFARRPAPAEAP